MAKPSQPDGPSQPQRLFLEPAYRATGPAPESRNTDRTRKQRGADRKRAEPKAKGASKGAPRKQRGIRRKETARRRAQANEEARQIALDAARMRRGGLGARGAGVTYVRAVSGGLPTLGKRR